MTYCIGITLDAGLVLASDSRTHAGVDNFASFCKITVFERAGDRVDLICYERDRLTVRMRRRFDEGDAYFSVLGQE